MTVLKTNIVAIKAHPNADNLEIATVFGFQTIVAKGQYRLNQDVFFYEPGLAFTLENAQSYGINRYLSPRININNEKVLVIKEVKLRGKLSEGLILAEEIACFKYEPPANCFSKTLSKPELAQFEKYGPLTNLRKEPNLFSLNDLVRVTEKIHGTNSRVGYYTTNTGKVIFCVGSRQLTRELDDELYGLPLKMPVIKKFFYGLIALGFESATLYGELYGPKIQNYSYAESATKYVAFTLKLNGNICSPEKFEFIMNMAGIPTALEVYYGLYSYEKIKELSEGPSVLAPNAGHKREGVVVQCDQTIAKLVSDTYLLKQKVETTDL
jgi:tRNA-binding EMAP/Myf-like protein